MLEVSKKRIVTTRKVHECYGCCDPIEKGVQAAHVSGKEDDRHVNFHLHENCHKQACKQNLYDEGFEKGMLIAKIEPLTDFSVAATEYPF